MNIVFHAHNASFDRTIHERAEHAIRKLASRLRRAVDATVRFATDGPVHRIEVALRASGRKPLVAVGTARRADVALNDAVARLEAHVAHEREAMTSRRRRRRGRALPSTDVLLGGADDAQEALEA